jgi:hypothetical protein
VTVVVVVVAVAAAWWVVVVDEVAASVVVDVTLVEVEPAGVEVPAPDPGEPHALSASAAVAIRTAIPIV